MTPSKSDEPKFTDKFVIFGSDTISYPDDLKLHVVYLFTASKRDTSYMLSVTRQDNMFINYNLTCKQGDITLIQTKGKAKLNETFFLGPEGDDDYEYGGYGSQEYFNGDNNCQVAIRIGIGFDTLKRHRAKVTYNCSDNSSFVLRLDNCPVLRTERNAL